MAWKYEPDENRKHKRGWKDDEAGFDERPGGELVGKCPANMTMNEAEALLNDEQAVAYHPPRCGKPYPDRVYNVHGGVLYRATWTTLGTSMHGFPEHASRAVQLPREVKEKILALAKDRNCLEEIRRCLNGKT